MNTGNMEATHAGRWENGQGLIEYALVLVLLGMVLIVVLTLWAAELEQLLGSLVCMVSSPFHFADCMEAVKPDMESSARIAAFMIA